MTNTVDETAEFTFNLPPFGLRVRNWWQSDLGTLPKKKNGKMWEFFPSGGPPPSPLFGNDTFVKKNYGLFCISGP